MPGCAALFLPEKFADITTLSGPAAARCTSERCFSLAALLSPVRSGEGGLSPPPLFLILFLSLPPACDDGGIAGRSNVGDTLEEELSLVSLEEESAVPRNSEQCSSCTVRSSCVVSLISCSRITAFSVSLSHASYTITTISGCIKGEKASCNCDTARCRSS